jgi:hypothetical protein
VTIQSLLIGRRFGDCIPAHQRITVRCTDGFEVDVDWASSGPEVRASRQGLVVPDRVLDPKFAYVCGKVIKRCLTNGSNLLIGFTDGHELAIAWDGIPDARAINVSVGLVGVSMSGSAGA